MSPANASTATALRAGITVLACVQLGLGIFMVVAPGSFYEALAHFGPANDHLIRDVGAFYLALGAGLLISLARPTWRAPMLVVGAVWYALHAANHALDIGRADPAWVGPADLALLVLGAVVFAVLARMALARNDGG